MDGHFTCMLFLEIPLLYRIHGCGRLILTIFLFWIFMIVCKSYNVELLHHRVRLEQNWEGLLVVKKKTFSLGCSWHLLAMLKFVLMILAVWNFLHILLVGHWSCCMSFFWWHLLVLYQSNCCFFVPFLGRGQK